MVTDHGFEQQLRKLISETQDELNKIETQIKLMENQRVSLVEELHSYEQTLRGYLRRTTGEKEEIQSVDWGELLKNCHSHKERLIKIAEQNNGELKLSSAVDIIYNGKFIKSKSRANAYIQIYSIMVEMIDKGELEKTDRGRYRLKQRGLL